MSDTPTAAPLDKLTKQELLAEARALQAERDQLLAQLQQAQAPADTRTDTHGLVPLVLHVSGVEWNGTHRRLVRCAAGGELADSWLVQVGDTMLTRHGHTVRFRPYRHVLPSLQDKVRFTLDEALALLRKL